MSRAWASSAEVGPGQAANRTEVRATDRTEVRAADRTEVRAADRTARQAVETVLGPVPAGALGRTLLHEHVRIDLWPWFDAPDPADPEAVAVAASTVGPGIAEAVRANPFAIRDNLRLDDTDLAARELEAFAGAGGATIVDLTPPEIGRDPAVLRELAARTGLAVIMGCGHYIGRAQPAAVAQAPVEALRDEILHDLLEGIDGARAGVIGEIGTSDPIEPSEERMLAAAAAAQRAVGCGLIVHLDPWGHNATDILDRLLGAGADPARCVLSHLDAAVGDLACISDLARRGVFVAIDIWGDEDAYGGRGMPTDEERVAAVLAAHDRGWADRLVLSQDVCLKSQLRAYGGRGYDHLLTTIAPRLAEAGLSASDVDRLLITNPRTVLAGPAG